MSDANFSLESLVEWYLLTDEAVIINLPTVLTSLNPGLFVLQPNHLVKWTKRINDLLRAKLSKFRWAGLCLAFATAVNSRDVMLEQAMNWIQIGTSLLSVGNISLSSQDTH
jgi:hypothetical protein